MQSSPSVTANDTRFYYINSESMIVKHYAAKQLTDPEGFMYAGMSQLGPVSAAGFYSKNSAGCMIVDGDEEVAEPDAAEPLSNDL